MVEDTFDWYAQDTVGNVWYLGEFTTAYEYNELGVLIGTNNEGSWEAGVTARSRVGEWKPTRKSATDIIKNTR